MNSSSKNENLLNIYHPGVQTADKNITIFHNIPLQSINPPINVLWSEKQFHH